MARPPARLALLGSLALALACGDDGDDDTAAGTTVADPTVADPTVADPTADATTATGTTEAADGPTTGTPEECEALACGEGELCVATGSCPEAPFCIAAAMVPCDFGTGLCTAMDVCMGSIQSGALLCETCL
jgi:hypothetical protein